MSVQDGDKIKRASFTATVTPRPFAEWHDDHVCAIWWMYPIDGFPYCGSPTSSDWPFNESHESHLWWTEIFGNEVNETIEATLGDAQQCEVCGALTDQCVQAMDDDLIYLCEEHWPDATQFISQEEAARRVS